MAITKMIMSVAQSLRNFLMTVIGTGLCRKYTTVGRFSFFGKFKKDQDDYDPFRMRGLLSCAFEGYKSF